MPYISQEARAAITDEWGNNQRRPPETLGELNYLITKICLAWLADYTGESYGTYAAVVGMLETVKLELYRRAVVPYEQAKCELNGDVYDIPEFDEGDLDE